MSRTLPVLIIAAASTATGCASDSDIWMLEIDAPAADACGDPIITHNFTYATAPDPTLEGDWEPGTRSESSREIVFAQLTTTTRSAGVLLIGDQSFPGTREGSDWTFEWSEGSGDASWQNHYSGYGNAEYLEVNEAVKITLSLENASNGAGSMKSDMTTTTTWKETDVWNEDAAAEIGWTGVIPAASFLEVPDDNGDVIAASNDGEVADCTSSSSPALCEIAETTVCEDNQKFKATRTDYKDEDAYEHLSTSGN